LRYILAVVLGVPHRLEDIEIVPARRVSIEGRAADPVQGDGDIVTRLPADIRIDEGGLDLVFPV
jgi:diacylglycerol kinase family enzyme